MHSVTFCHRTMRLLVLPASQQPGQDLGQTVPYSILHSVMAALASPLVGPVADARLTAVLPLDLQLLKTDADFILGQNTGIYRHCPLCSSVRSTKGVGTSQLLSLDNRLGKPEHALPNRHNASCGPRVLFRLLKDVIWLSWHNRAVLLQLLPLCRHKRLSDPAVCQLRDTQWWEVNSEKKETEQLVCFCWFSLLNSGVRQVPALTQWRGWSRSRKFSIMYLQTVLQWAVEEYLQVSSISLQFRGHWAAETWWVLAPFSNYRSQNSSVNSSVFQAARCKRLMELTDRQTETKMISTRLLWLFQDTSESG